MITPPSRYDVATVFLRPLPRAARACLLLLGVLALACIVGPWLLGFDPHRPDWNWLSAAPSLQSGHWFGTDAIGRDVLARTLAGGNAERAMVRALDVLSALPFLLIVIQLLSLFGRSLFLLLAAIGGYVWIDLARVMRAEAGRLREAPFVLASRAAGASFGQQLRWHLLPNLLPLALVYLGLILPQAILVESFLGFLGLSVDELSASWGTFGTPSSC